jgi:nitrogen fixation NifU-like protein
MDIYSEIILDHFKNPQNKKKMENPSTQAKEENPLCGDHLKIYLKIDQNNKIIKATFEGEGCAISQASASMLTEKLKGKSLNQIEKLKNEEIFKMLNIQISPGRSKCALLSLNTTKKAIKNFKPPRRH